VRVDRPQIPDGYGAEAAGGFLSWDEVVDRLARARTYWLSTTRPDGRPHVVPRWGAWLDGAFWYDGSPQTRHAKNLAENGACALSVGDNEVTIVEGVSVASDPIAGELGGRLSDELSRKYAPTYVPSPDSWSDETAGGLRTLTPAKIIAWDDFPGRLTRFTLRPPRL